MSRSSSKGLVMRPLQSNSGLMQDIAFLMWHPRRAMQCYKSSISELCLASGLIELTLWWYPAVEKDKSAFGWPAQACSEGTDPLPLGCSGFWLVFCWRQSPIQRCWQKQCDRDCNSMLERRVCHGRRHQCSLQQQLNLGYVFSTFQ